MVYGIIQQHKGMIEVESEPGAGSTFRLYIPMIAEEPAEEKPAADPNVPGGGESILVAEDEGEVRRLVTLLLESKGYTVLTASNGKETLQMLADHKERIDLALLDVVMPEIGGRELYEKIKEIRPSLRVLFNTGYAAETIDTNFLSENKLKIIQKPYTPEVLLRVVREMLDQRN